MLYPIVPETLCFMLGYPMLQTLTLGHKPLTLTLIHRSHIHPYLTHTHNTFFPCYFFQLCKHNTQHVFLICQLVSAPTWSNSQNRWKGCVSMPPPDILSDKARPHTWSLEKKNPPKDSISTIGPSMRYFIFTPTTNPRGSTTGNFTVKLDERWCECGKFLKSAHALFWCYYYV